MQEKKIQILKEEVNPLLFADDIHKSTNDFSKVAGYKINIQKSVASPEYNYEQSAREIKKTIQFTGESNRIKYQGINFERPQTENYKTLKKEVNDEKNIWKDKWCLWIEGESILLKHP